MFRGVLIFLLLGSVNFAMAAETPGEVYINRTFVQNQMVNHLHFINEGQFDVFGSHPWDGQSILTFTNRAEMSGSPGFRFETVDPVFGFRAPAQVFYNSPNGNIEAADTGIGIILIGGGFRPISTSLLKVNALNVTNRGILKTGASGYIQMFGQNVDLTAGALIVGDLFDPLSGGQFNSGFPASSNSFFPSAGIFDLGWGIGGDTNASAQGVIASVNPTDIGTLTPAPRITNTFGGGFRLDNAMTWVREEIIDETNEVVQVIAVQVADTNISVFSSFIPQTFDPAPLQGGFLTAAVELRVPSTDFATLARVTNSLYVLDQLGAHTNRDVMLNELDGTFRPGNFIVHRGFPNLYGGELSTTNIRDDLFTVRVATVGTNIAQYDYLNPVLSNEWSIYSFEVASVPVRLPQIPGISHTNIGGQVEVRASQLKLANTRIRGEGFVSLTASNVVTMAGLSNIVDVPRISIDFRSAPETLTVNEFLPDNVERFTGGARAYSSIFTNSYETYLTNAPADPADTNIVIVTNTVQVRFQLTLVDGRNLRTTEDTVVHDLLLTSTNGRGAVVFNEDLDVTNYVQIRAKELTIAEGGRLAGSLGVHFSYTNLQGISVITNLGTIELVERADLRQGINQPYARFVNHGGVFAYGAEIWADYFENAGDIITFQNIDIRASTLRIDSGIFLTDGDIRLRADVAKLSNLQAQAGARLVLDVSQTLTDTGLEGANDILVSGGFEMSSRRPVGDLLGTTITSTAETFQFIDHIWAAEDRGATAAGFANNLALGRLVLDGAIRSVFQFLPALGNSAMYIDVLEFGGEQAVNLAALTNGMLLGMNVYYADVVSTNTEITAQSLDRIFGPDAPFNLIWVPEFAGPNSAVDVPLGLNGPVGRMNRGLRDSQTADTDGDGVPNARDPYPMTASGGGETIDIHVVGLQRDAATGQVTLSLAGPPSAQYVVEYSTNLIAPQWQAVTGVLTDDTVTGLKKFTGQLNPESAQGYYRVRLAP